MGLDDNFDFGFLCVFMMMLFEASLGDRKGVCVCVCVKFLNVLCVLMMMMLVVDKCFGFRNCRHNWDALWWECVTHSRIFGAKQLTPCDARV